jgi:long-chain acyl-CoA synthetase
MTTEARTHTVRSILSVKAEHYADRPALSLLAGGRWSTLTYRQLTERVDAYTGWLLHAGIRRGDRIAILSESRPEWGMAFFGAVLSGATVVPLDTKLTPVELAALVTDAQPRVLFASSELAATARHLQSACAAIEHVIGLDAGPGDVPCIGDVVWPPGAAGPERHGDETALIVYTSGTTGQPKGVMVSFDNLIFQVERLEAILRLQAGDAILSILPLNHLLELTCGLLGALHAGAHVCYCQTLYPDEIVAAMREQRVRAMVTVPLFLKMLARGLEREARRAGPARRLAFNVAWALSPFVPPGVRRLLFRPVHRALGGRLRGFFSGGAPLEPDVAEFFRRLGIPVYAGYGLTETSPVVAVNRPGASRLGSVGRALDGVEIKILSEGPGEDGEILTRGPHVMQGYYRRPDLTGEVIDAAGWFHTGDVGRLDPDGFLHITGRLKSLIVLAGGKKVHPEEVESVLAASPAIKEVCVLAVPSSDGLTSGGEEVCAVVVPADGTREDEVRGEVERLSARLAPYKRPRSVRVWPGELPKTPSRKIKRALVLDGLGDKEPGR